MRRQRSYWISRYIHGYDEMRMPSIAVQLAILESDRLTVYVISIDLLRKSIYFSDEYLTEDYLKETGWKQKSFGDVKDILKGIIQLTGECTQKGDVYADYKYFLETGPIR